MWYNAKTAVCLLVLAWGAGTSRVFAQTSTSTLEVTGPFSTIQSCISASLLVKPGDSYTVEVTGDENAIAATSASVNSEVLSFAVKGPLRTNSPFYITVTMPSDALTELTQSSSGNGDIVINSGFEAKDFKLTTDGNGALTLGVDVTDTLTADVGGNGAIFLQGTIADADITNSGNGAFNLYDLTGTADVDLSGNGAVFINGASGSSITGTNSGNGALLYSGAMCDVSQEGFGGNCIKTGAKPASKVAVSGFPLGSSYISGDQTC